MNLKNIIALAAVVVATDVVEWVVPRTVMPQLVIASEKL